MVNTSKKRSRQLSAFSYQPSDIRKKVLQPALLAEG